MIWILLLGLLAGGNEKPSASNRPKLTVAQANAKKVAGQEWHLYYIIGDNRWRPEYHPERKGTSILYLMQVKDKGRVDEFHLYLNRSHRYRSALEGLPMRTFVIFRYSEQPQQTKVQYAAAYLIPVKYALIQDNGTPGRWSTIKP